MGTRGRKSAAALALTAPIDIRDRPKAPHNLNDEETEVWFAVINRMPADWFGPETVPLLSQYCRHVVQSSRVAQLIEQAAGGPSVDVKDYDRLLKMQDRESKAIALLATKMRIAQQSTTNHRGNHKRTLTLRPWETEEDEADKG